MKRKPPVLFIAGTGQHSGKTLVSLGLVMHARSTGMEARYMKPVGQRTVEMDGRDGGRRRGRCSSNVCDLPTSPKLASPITLPSGFTRDFLLAGKQPDELEQRIMDGFAEVSDGADIVIVEGTGHAGVGSVVDLSNARVASLLGAEVIIVTSGGIGRPIDELCLNQALFAREGVPEFGVVFNKVLASRMEETREPVLRLGAQPQPEHPGHDPLRPAAEQDHRGADRARDRAVVHSGHKSLGCLIDKIIVGAESPHRFLGSFGPGVLALIPGDREDLILAAVSAQHTERAGDGLHGGHLPDQRHPAAPQHDVHRQAHRHSAADRRGRHVCRRVAGSRTWSPR